METEKLLQQWLEFAKDVQASCAAGYDELNALRETTAAKLELLAASKGSARQAVTGSQIISKAIERSRHIDANKYNGLSYRFGYMAGYEDAQKDAADE